MRVVKGVALRGGMLLFFFAPGLAAQLPEGQETGSIPDDYDLSARSETNVQMFQKAFYPSPGSTPAQEATLAPIYQSLSLQAGRVDTPIADDSLDLQVAAWGQVTPGAPEGTPSTDWDLSTASVTQRIGLVHVSLGRQVAAGGAARYSRLDGAQVTARLPFGLSFGGYGGWTALPRFNDRYGYHRLGDSYEDWSKAPEAYPKPERSKNVQGGARVHYQSGQGDLVGLSFHQQGDDLGISQQSLALHAALARLKSFELRANADLSISQERFSDLRASGTWQVLPGSPSSVGVDLRAEALHTVPALLLSQTSVFSVFAQQEVSEFGGELSTRLPIRMRLDWAAYGQVYNEGSAGMRSFLNLRYASDDDKTLMLRATAARVLTDDNGYWLGRTALSYALSKNLRAVVDMHQYLYDQEIRGIRSSSHYAAHFVFSPEPVWNARLGGFIARTPYARADAQVLARFTYEWDTSRRRRL